jgi:Concanavalin A-like lectin/glucanases superfamily
MARLGRGFPTHTKVFKAGLSNNLVTLAVASSATVSLTKQRNLVLSVISATSDILNTLKLKSLNVLSVASAATATLTRATGAGRILLVTSSATNTITRSISKLVALNTSPVIRMTKQIGKLLMPKSPGPATAPYYPGNVLSNSPVIYLRLNDAVASTVAVDSSSSGDNGAVNGTVTFGINGAIAGSLGTAAQFDGSTGYLELGSSQVPTFQNHDFSVEYWERHTASAANVYVFSVGLFNSISADTFLHVGFDSTEHLKVGFFNDDLVGTSVVKRNQWNHVVATWSAATKQRILYLNGVADSTGVSSGSLNVPGGATAQVARVSFATGIGPFFFGGAVDEFAVYGSVLSPAQVLANYNAARTLGVSTSAGIAPGLFRISPTKAVLLIQFRPFKLIVFNRIVRQ